MPPITLHIIHGDRTVCGAPLVYKPFTGYVTNPNFASTNPDIAVICPECDPARRAKSTPVEWYDVEDVVLLLAALFITAIALPFFIAAIAYLIFG